MKRSSLYRASIACGFIAAFVGTFVGKVADAADGGPIQNAGFEKPGSETVSQAIPGWTTYGAPTSSIAVEPDEDDAAAATLRVSRGKAFCYEIPLSPETDYVLSLRVRARHAKPWVEVEPAIPGRESAIDEPPGVDWKTVEIQLPAAARPPGARAMWLALGGQPTQPGGAVWYDEVKLEPVGGGVNLVPNSSFEESAPAMTVPPGWAAESGGAEISSDTERAVEGSRSLKITGIGRQVRIAQPLDLTAFHKRGVKRIRISGQGRSRGLGDDRVRLEVYGAVPPVRPILSLSGDMGWTKGECVIAIDPQRDGRLAVWIHAPRPFEGDAWFDDLRVEPVPDTEVVNLLANTTFRQALTNPKLPDFWGLWGDAVLCVEPWSYDFFCLANEPGPFPGVGVLRVEYPSIGRFVPVPPAKKMNVFVLAGSGRDLPKGTYTFSIYAKAARPGTLVQIRHPASASTLTAAGIGPKWQRIAATSDNPSLLPAIHLPEPGSVVWLAAPQLEPGSAATSFRPSPGETLDAVTATESDAVSALKPRDRDDDATPSAVPPELFKVYAEFDRIADEASTRARIEWLGDTPATIHWRLLDATTGTKLAIPSQSITVESRGVRNVAIPAADLPFGAIGIQSLAVVDNKTVARANDSFTKAARVPHEVRTNRFTRSILVDGKPFLPIFLPIEPRTLGDWHLERLAKAGFNCLAAAPGRLKQADIIRGGIPSAAAAAIRTQLDRLHSHGMKILWPLPWSFDDWGRTPELYKGDIRGLAKTYQRVVAAFRDHPAIIGWYLMDEPSKRSWEGDYHFKEDGLRALWAAVKAVDDTRPAYVNWNHSWAIEPYGGLECTDIVGHDNYSISGEPFDLEELVPSVRMVNDARARGKPAFAWISGSYDETMMRPSAGAVRVHAWLHLVYGTRGLGYWSKPPLDRAAWDVIRNINREAVTLHQHVLGDPDAMLVASGRHDPSIHWALWTAGDAACLLGVNTARAEVPFTLNVAKVCGRDVKSASRLFDAGPLESRGGIVDDRFPPHGRRVYRFSLALLPE